MSEPVRYREAPWPVLRNAVESVLRQHRSHTSWGFAEVDVTDALHAIRSLQRRLRMGISFHAFVLHCLAQAAKEHEGVQTFRYGRRLITFEDVDVATVIDKRFPNGVRIPAGYTVRKAQEKSLAQINWELRQGIRTNQSHVESVRLRQAVTRLPSPLRRLVSWWMGRNPFLLRRFHGTIGLTNIQTPGFDRPFYGLPPNIYTLTLAVGNITERTVLDVNGKPEARKFVCLSAGADHAVIDGAALASFARRLCQLIECASGLDEDFVRQTHQLIQEKAQ